MVEFRNFGFVLRGAGLTTVLPIVLHTKVLLEAKKNVWLIQPYFNLSQDHLGIVKKLITRSCSCSWNILFLIVLLVFVSAISNLIDWQGWPLSPACFSHTLPLRVTNSRYGLQSNCRALCRAGNWDRGYWRPARNTMGFRQERLLLGRPISYSWYSACLFLSHPVVALLTAWLIRFSGH